MWPLLKKRIARARIAKHKIDPSIPRLPFYYRLLKFLKSIGFDRSKYETSTELARRVTLTGSGYAPEVERLTQAFERTVYGERKLSAGEEIELENTVTRMIEAENKRRNKDGDH